MPLVVFERRAIVSAGRGFMPAGYMDGVKKKLVYAGRTGALELDRFRLLRVLSVTALPLLFVALTFAPGPPRA